MATKVTYIKTSSFSKKILQLLAAVALVVVTLTLWADIKQKGEAVLVENAIVLAKNILKQTSHSASFYMENKDQASLDHLTESALKSDYIYEMLIYDKTGTVLSKSENALPAVQRFMNVSSASKHGQQEKQQERQQEKQKNEPNKKSAETINEFLPTPYVSEVIGEKGQLLGFVRVTVLTKNLQKSGLTYINSLTKQVILIALLAGFIGYLFTNGLKPFSANAYVVKD